jgi:hypothetical protein
MSEGRRISLCPLPYSHPRLRVLGSNCLRKYHPANLSAVPKIQDVCCQWADEFAFIAPRRVGVDAEEESRNGSPAPGVACFFSGGLDSFHTLFKNLDKITHLIFVHGIDIPLNNSALRTRPPTRQARSQKRRVSI